MAVPRTAKMLHYADAIGPQLSSFIES